jgi:hypothetical protein
VLRDLDPESGVSVYTSSLSSLKLVVLLCVLHVTATEVGDKISAISRDISTAMNTIPEFRLYGLLTVGQIMEVHKKNHILVMNSMTPDPVVEQAFHAWYTVEHIPLLQRVPFWLSSERFTLVSSTDASLVPRYLALHKWDDITAFESDEYKAATNTPWRTEVIGKVMEKERLVLKYEGQLEDLMVSVSAAF